uniref:Vomeronasal 2, receptor 1 n=1 Tax=Cynoglossus semilaevis TaxID=244447 RepID=A0A3P8UK58_CYNSE
MEIRLLWLGFCAFSCLCRCASAASTCKLKARFTLNGYKDVEKKQVVIGGMFPVHKRIASTNSNSSRAPVSSACEGFNFRTFRWTQTMLFAINEINNNKELLPDTDLGYVIYDSCFTISKAVEGTLTYLTGQDEAVPNYRCGDGPPLAALVGPGGTDLAIATARILGLYHFPQVSYSSTCSFLSTKYQFPTFLRTIPNDVHQSAAMAQMVLHFGWTWVGTIAADDDYGKYGIKDFKEQVEEAGVCISFSETLPKTESPEDIQRIVDTVIESTAKIIVVFSSDVDFSPLLLELLRHNVTNRTWIASEAWITSALINQPEVGSLLGGTLGFGVKKADIPDLQRHLLDLDPYDDDLTEEFWETAFDCTLDPVRAMRSKQRGANGTRTEREAAVKFCSGTESLSKLNNTYSDVSQLRITYSVYKAVYAVANALHNLEHCVDGQGPFKGKSCADISRFEPWQLMYYMKHARFTVPHTNEEIYFDDGEAQGYYDIINWQVNSGGEVSFVTVGQYNGSAAPQDRMTIANGQTRLYCANCQPGTRKGIRQGEPVCCFDCIPCADGEISNSTNARECVLCGEDDWSNEAHDTCIPKIIEFLSYAEALGITLIALSAAGALVTITVVFFLHINTPMVKANDALLSFSLIFSLVVTFLSSIVFLGEPQEWNCMTSQVGLALGFAIALSSIMGGWSHPQRTSPPPGTRVDTTAILCTVWLIVFPPHPFKNTKTQVDYIYLQCARGSDVLMCIVFGYDVLLAFVAFVLSFLARKLEDNAREGKSLTFSLLVFFIVWIAFVPAYLSTVGKFMVAVQIFAILASSLGMLICIFLPKCYVILVKAERNTEETMKPRPKPRDGSSTGTSASLSTVATTVTTAID